jgi:hypothetical protein
MIRTREEIQTEKPTMTMLIVVKMHNIFEVFSFNILGDSK